MIFYEEWGISGHIQSNLNCASDTVSYQMSLQVHVLSFPLIVNQSKVGFKVFKLLS